MVSIEARIVNLVKMVIMKVVTLVTRVVWIEDCQWNAKNCPQIVQDGWHIAISTTRLLHILLENSPD